MNELKIFENPQFGEIRVIQQDGEPWFVAADVCRALELANTTMTLDRLDDDERSKFNLGRQGDTWCVNEPGLYALVLGSRKPEAKAFKRWITHEVIPSIRKTGSYTFDGTSKELQAIIMIDRRTVQHEQRITALEESMVIDYNQQRILAARVNAVVTGALGGAESVQKVEGDLSVKAEEKIAVVRCKDCVHYTEKLPAVPGFSGVGFCEYYSPPCFPENHFCSLGKWRD